MASSRPVPAPVDRYEVLAFLAEGGMGAIYIGKKHGAGGFEKQVVLKQLRPEYTEQPEFIELFLREARLSASLDHANIVHTIDLVRAGADYFMVMEYVRGGDLRILLKRARKRKKRLLPAAALYIAREVLGALAYAHARTDNDGKPLGLIHRDVSPSNILVSASGEVKLTDFGIAKATTHHSTFYRVRGKIGYMSPEQARSQRLEPRSDVYSVAVILWEMLTGEKLHVAASLTTSADEMYAKPAPPASQKVPGLPRELDWVLAKGLAVDASARYQSAGELAEDLLKIAAKNDLMYSPLALAKHLVDVCGPVEEWGSAVVREVGTDVSVGGAKGGGTEQLPPEEEPAKVEEDLVWVDNLREAAPAAVVRERAESSRDFAQVQLSPVEEFVAARVESIAPSVVRPRRRVPSMVIATLIALAAVTLAVVIGIGGVQREPAPAPAPPPPPPAPAPKGPVKLAIDSEPPRARVLVDGLVRCVTPCTLDVPPAPVTIRLARDGFVDWSAVVVPGGDGVKAKLRHELPHGASGTVSFGAGPAANVLVDGRAIGYATSTGAPLVLPAGDHTLALEAPGGERREVRVNVKPGANVELSP
jgi:serine/threonine protein kinase